MGTYFLIGSISWYFMITITICSSLFNRVSISNIDRINKYHYSVIVISFCVTFTQLYIAQKSGDYDFSDIKTNLPTIITECIYLCVCFLAIIYIKCCYPFYFVGEDRFRMILYLLVFIALWLFPSIYNVLSPSIATHSNIYFAKQICINLTGLATMIIWRFLSVFPNRSYIHAANEKYKSIDDATTRNQKSSISTTNTSGFPLAETQKYIDSESPNEESIRGEHQTQNISNESSILWLNRHSKQWNDGRYASQQTTNHELDENNLCLSPSLNDKRSYFERTKRSITEFFGSHKNLIEAEEEQSNNIKRSNSIRISKNNQQKQQFANYASENQYDYYVHAQNGMIPPTNHGMTQKTPHFKQIKLPNGQYQKIYYSPDGIIQDDDALIFKYAQNEINIYDDSDYDDALNKNKKNEANDVYASFERTP